jgi:hypothetical protein
MPLSLCTLNCASLRTRLQEGLSNPSLDMLGDPRSGNKV